MMNDMCLMMYKMVAHLRRAKQLDGVALVYRTVHTYGVRFANANMIVKTKEID